MKLLAAVLLALSVLACGSESPAIDTAAEAPARPATPPPPAPAEIRELIASSGAFGEFEFTRAAVTLPMQKSAMNAFQLSDAEQLVKAGWLAFDGSGAVVLVKAKGDKRFLVRPNGFLDVVPIAKKEMGDVSGVRPTTAGEAEADFAFRWVPTEVGTAFTSGPSHDLFAQSVDARATLLWDGTRWDVLSIARR